MEKKDMNHRAETGEDLSSAFDPQPQNEEQMPNQDMDTAAENDGTERTGFTKSDHLLFEPLPANGNDSLLQEGQLSEEEPVNVENLALAGVATAGGTSDTFTDSDDFSGAADAPAAKKKKSRKALWIVLGIIFGLLLATYLGGVYYFKNHFFFNSEVNGFNVTGKTAEDLDQELKTLAASHNLTLTERGGVTETLNADQINFHYVSDGKVQQLLSSQNPWVWPASLFSDDQLDMKATFAYDEAKLTETVNKLAAVSGASIVKVENAKPVYQNGAFVIQPEVDGNELNMEAFNKEVVNALLAGEDSIDLDSAGCYKAPSIRKDSKELAATVDTMNSYLNGTITYTFGDAHESITKDMIASWLSANDKFEINVNHGAVKEYIAGLSDKYDTYGITRQFRSSYGSTVSVYGGDYGWLIDTDGEVAKVDENIRGAQPVTREPVYAQKGAVFGTNDVGNSYVEISISGQTMWLYVNGSQIVSTPIVTGSVAGGYSTPGGTYGIAYTARNVTLRGEGYASPVTFWIPFNGDIGIHDASWRSSFGGDIYLSNGSHGCVNTPYAAAQTIFNNVDAGFPVVVY